MKYLAAINVTLKKSVLDPQGKTVLHALHSLDFQETQDARVGKYFEVTLEASNKKKAEERLKSMCEKLLINPIIEQYTFEVRES